MESIQLSIWYMASAENRRVGTSPVSFNPVATPDLFASHETLALLDLTNAYEYLEFGATGHSHISWFGQEIVAQSL